jgi:hypothetical protein
MVNTKKTLSNTDQKYQIGINLTHPYNKTLKFILLASQISMTEKPTEKNDNNQGKYEQNKIERN